MISRLAGSLLVSVLLLTLVPVEAQETVQRDRVTLWLPAVGQNPDGTLFGAASSLAVIMETPGAGQVFLSSEPLTDIDMQGSARLAVATAGAITGIPVDDKDFFFIVRTDSVTVGGPSGGGAMAVAVIALLEGWDLRDDVMMTGMIDPDGSIGPVGGILQKVEAADSVDAKTFLIPLGQAFQAGTDAQTGEPVTVDVKAYAKDRYGIDVVEIADVYDAVAPFTGFRLVRPEPSLDPVRGEAYAGITARLAANLTQQATDRLADLDGRWASVQDQAGPGDTDVISTELQNARDRLDGAQDARDDEQAYLASSLAFQALVSLGNAGALIAYHEGGTRDATTFSNEYLGETDERLASVATAIQPTYPLPAARLDTQGAAEQRHIEALAAQTGARQQLQVNDYAEALRLSSFARERAESARWWVQIGVEVSLTGSTPSVTREAVEALMHQYADTAQLQIEYVALIAPNQPAFAAARAALQASQDALAQGRHAAALFELAEVLAQINTALVSLAGVEPVRARLGTLADSAAYHIELAQAQGAPPMYAISLFELAKSRADSDPVGAYASYSTARISAGASLQATGAKPPPPDIERVEAGGWASLRDVAPLLVAYGLISAVVVLLTAVWVFGVPGRRDAAKPAPPENPNSSPGSQPASPEPAAPTPHPAATVPMEPTLIPLASEEAAPDEESGPDPRAPRRSATPRRRAPSTQGPADKPDDED